MALAAKRGSTDTPRGNRTPPKHVIGQAGTHLPVLPDDLPGPTIPTNPQPNLDGVVENQPTLSAFPKRRTVVDSQYVPLSHLIVNAEGDKWPVNYYRQNLGMNDELMPMAKGTTGVHQQYTKYIEFIIHVISPLTPQQDSETKEFTVTGEATMFFGLIPNKGDMFIADVGNGQAGLFTITETERLTYTKEACYTVRYQMVDYLNDEQEQQLESKVIRTYYFELALAELLERPFLTEADYNTYINLNEQTQFLKSYFERMFWSRIAGNIALPEQLELTHDTYHAAFCANVGLGTPRNPIISYTNGYMSNSEVYTIWDAFKDMDVNQLSFAQPTFGIATASTFMEATVARGIAWSQYYYTVYPTADFFSPNRTESVKTTVSLIKPLASDAESKFKYNNGVCMVDQSIVDEDRFILPPKKPSGDRTIAQATEDGIDIDIDDSEWNPQPSWDNLPVVEELKTFPKIGDDFYYVLTKAFYEQDLPKMTPFEISVLDMLKGRPVASKDVALYCKQVRKCSLLEQFYFIPVILLLIKYTKRGSL